MLGRSVTSVVRSAAFFIGTVVGTAQAASVGVPRWDPPQLAVGRFHACLIEDIGRNADEWGKTRVLCEGENSYGQRQVPPDLLAPSALAAGLNYTCAVDSGIVRCWGFEGAARTHFFRELNHVRKIAAGFSALCVADEQVGIVCREEDGIVHRTRIAQDVPKGWKGIQLLSLGYSHACAADARGKVLCWGGLRDLESNPDQDFRRRHLLINERIVNIPKLHTAPAALSVGYSHVCVALADTVRCWGTGPRGMPWADTMVGFRNVRGLASGFHNVCALAPEGTRCWGSKGAETQQAQASLIYPLAIAHTPDFFLPSAVGFCAMDYRQAKCYWGKGPRDAAAPTDFRHESFDFLAQLDDTLARTSERVSTARVSFFARVQKIVAQMPVTAAELDASGKIEAQSANLRGRIFVMSALAPFFDNLSSAYFENAVLPRFVIAHHYYKQKFNVESLASLGRDTFLLRLACDLAQSVIASLARTATTSGDDEILLKNAMVALVKAAKSLQSPEDLAAARLSIKPLLEPREGLGEATAPVPANGKSFIGSPKRSWLDLICEARRTQGMGLVLSTLFNYLGVDHEG